MQVFHLEPLEGLMMVVNIVGQMGAVLMTIYSATTSPNGFVKDNLDNEVILEFLNIDGMYARCSFHGNYEYILAQTDVVLI